MWLYNGTHRNPKGDFEIYCDYICEECGSRFRDHGSIGMHKGQEGISPCTKEEEHSLRMKGLNINSDFDVFIMENYHESSLDISKDVQAKEIASLIEAM